MNAVLSSFVAFLAAVVHPRTPLVRAIRLAIVIKLIALIGIGVVMVPGARHAVDATAMFRLMAPPPSASSQQGH